MSEHVFENNMSYTTKTTKPNKPSTIVNVEETISLSNNSIEPQGKSESCVTKALPKKSIDDENHLHLTH